MDELAADPAAEVEPDPPPLEGPLADPGAGLTLTHYVGGIGRASCFRGFPDKVKKNEDAAFLVASVCLVDAEVRPTPGDHIVASDVRYSITAVAPASYADQLRVSCKLVP